ncbi:hypothetical protein AB8O55_03470 [Saccharopolyspora cebuensis]|uniref:MYXO-CTERM domain-containing protein n=1 Tax=Saccharopolyspora cebuensis TaxID=418759 RepID=A0ABV4CBK7_9PSEU
MVTGRRRLLPGCLLVLLSAVIGLAGVGAVLAASFGGTSFGREEPYRWDDGALVLDFTRPTSCAVVPEAGQRREVRPVRQREQLEVDRWFAGPAEITCGTAVTAWQGSGASLRSFTSSPPFEYGLAALVVLPLAGAVFVLVRRR